MSKIIAITSTMPVISFGFIRILTSFIFIALSSYLIVFVSIKNKKSLTLLRGVLCFAFGRAGLEALNHNPESIQSKLAIMISPYWKNTAGGAQVG